jgi:hypothetical protein
MSRDKSLRYRVRCSEVQDNYCDTDFYEFFPTQEAATQWAKKALRAGRFKRLMIQDMSPVGINGWNTPVVDEFIAPLKRQNSN